MCFFFKKKKKEKGYFLEISQPKHDDLKKFVYRWNVDYPIDRWWRMKHNIRFGSPEHRVSSLVDQLVEWEEDQIYSGAFQESQKEKYIQDSGNYLKVREVEELDESTDDELMQYFNSLGKEKE